MSLKPIDFGSSPKLGQRHNMVGGVIWWVLREIQSPELCNALTTTFTEWTSNELEMSNFFEQMISDQAQNLETSLCGGRSHLGSFERNPIPRTIQSCNHFMYVTNFIRTWSVQFLWLIDFRSSSKPGKHYNTLGGVIWWVLSEIQSLEVCNPPITPFTVPNSNELEESNFFEQMISDRAQNLGDTIIWWEESFGEFWEKSKH